ncbi:MAG: aspartate kinase [Paludibacteraceae bacterium]|nr:aspartate kinase [Paludibacteraceae bacterium]
MKILKFGGTSVGSAARMKAVASLIADGEHKIVVLSAMSGTTNHLIQMAEYIRLGNASGATDMLEQLNSKYRTECAGLEIDFAVLQPLFASLRKLCLAPYTPQTDKEVVSFGELISTTMMATYMTQTGQDAVLMPALDYMRINADGEPDLLTTERLLREQLATYDSHRYIITQGFICRNAAGQVDNLKRGGSDYTASVVGALLDAQEIQIWTDIDGMHNNDPRYVQGTQPVRHISFDEAAELAYFGAKILHPTCILPAKMHNVPVRLLNTMAPDAPGTLIDNHTAPVPVKAVAAKDGIYAVRVQSGRMLMAYGFLSRVFAIFEKYRTSIDLITTSEVAVSMSVDNGNQLQAIADELRTFGTVSIEKNMSIISVVGDLRADNRGIESLVVQALKDIPIRMISYGGSEHNISLLVASENKVPALQALSAALFK